MGEIIVTQARSNLNLNNRNPLRSVTKAEYTKTLLGEDSISLTVESKTVLDFHINDYIDLRNKRYTLNTAPKVKKEQGFYTYDLTFEGMQYRLRKKIYFNLDTQGYQTTGNFPLTSTIETFLQVLISNINQVDDFTWTLGEYPQNSETKTLTFSDENCLAVLQKICKEYDTEFEIAEDITHKRCVLNIKKFGETLPFTFEYGKGNGLYSLSRDNVNDEVITRLYVYGSTENLKADYRNFSERLKLPTSYGREYIEDGAKVKQYGLIEGIKTFDDIKPTFKGIVSAVGTLENGVQKLVVRNMDFDLNEKEKDKVTTKYLIAGTAAKLHFNKGNLAGYEFELSKYDHSTKTFSLKQFKDERGQAFPDAKATAFQFNVGDEFTLLDITMPDRYITNAENKLLQEGLKEYEKRSVNNLKYALDIDPMFLKDKGNTGTKFFSVGDYISIKDEALGVDKTSRIITLREDLLQEYKYNIDIADTYSISFVESIVSDIKDNQTVIKSIEKINKDNFRRGYANLKELKENIFDTDGYFDTEHIKPNSIEANMIAIGARSQQFALENITLNPNVRGNPANIHITAGNLVHFSIADSPKTWNLLEFYQTGLLNQVYYVYAKCEKTGNIGSWYVTTEKIKFDERPQHYYFLCYLLYTPVAGKRSAEAMYGNTILHGGQITTGRISSVNGQTYFDLDSGEISGKIRFTADSPAIEQVKDSVEDDLGTLAFEDSVEKSMLGNTIIQGGYIKTELINAAAIISNGGGATTEALNNAIKGIVVGGRNLALNSESPKLTPYSGSTIRYTENYAVSEWNTTKAVRHQVTGGRSSTYAVYSFGAVPNGELRTLSFFIKNLKDTPIVFSANIGRPITVQPNEIKRVVFEGLLGNGVSWVQILLRTTDADFAIWRVKLEKGNKATDWTPAPEDVEAMFENLRQGIANMQISLHDVKTKTDNFTSIQGGLISSNIISVGSNQANQNAFISGVTDAGAKSIRFGAGANYANKNNAPFRVLDNGKMIAQDAEISGKINATSGQIARFSITENTLSGRGIADVNDYLEIKSSGSFLSYQLSSSTGREGTFIINNSDRFLNNNKNNIARIIGRDPEDSTPYNALSISAQGRYATALNIEEGNIVVGGEKGYTGKYELSRTERVLSEDYLYKEIEWETKNLIINKGIVTDIKTERGTERKRKR